MNYLERKKFILMKNKKFKGYSINSKSLISSIYKPFNNTPISMTIYGNTMQFKDNSNLINKMVDNYEADTLSRYESMNSFTMYNTVDHPAYTNSGRRLYDIDDIKNEELVFSADIENEENQSEAVIKWSNDSQSVGNNICEYHMSSLNRKLKEFTASTENISDEYNCLGLTYYPIHKNEVVPKGTLSRWRNTILAKKSDIIPSLSNPVPIKSFGEKSTANIIDMSKHLNSNLIENEDGTYTLNKGNSISVKLDNPIILDDMPHTFLFRYELCEHNLSSDYALGINLQYTDSDNVMDDFNMPSRISEITGNRSITKMTRISGTITHIQLYLSHYNDSGYIKFKNPCLKIDPITDIYEEYNSYNIPLVISGKNIMPDISKAESYTNCQYDSSTNSIVSNVPTESSDKYSVIHFGYNKNLGIHAGQTYIFSLNNIDNLTAKTQVVIYGYIGKNIVNEGSDYDKIYIGDDEYLTLLDGGDSSTKLEYTYTKSVSSSSIRFTIPNIFSSINAIQFRFNINEVYDTDLTYNNFMLTQIINNNEYEDPQTIYSTFINIGKEPLCKIFDSNYNNISDTVDIDFTSKIATLTKRTKFFNKEDISPYAVISSSNGKTRFFLSTPESNNNNINIQCVCNIMKYSSGDTYIYQGNNKTPSIYINDSIVGIEDTDSNSTKLSKIKSWFNNLDDIKLLVSRTPETIDISDRVDWDILSKLYNGTTVIQAGKTSNEVGPLDISINYNSKQYQEYKLV